MSSSTAPLADDDILDMIFSPDGLETPIEAVGAKQQQQTQSTTPPVASTIDPALLKRVREIESRAILACEEEYKKAAEAVAQQQTTNGDATNPASTSASAPAAPTFTQSLQLLDECIALAPTYASAYNNRAQVRLLLVKPSSSDMTVAASSSSSSSPLLTSALADLALAIQHGASDSLVLRQAHTQRGMIYRLQHQDDLAFAEYQLGAKYGSNFARQEAVKVNPYAKLCNQYLTAAMKDLTMLAKKEEVQQQPQQDCASLSSTAADVPQEKLWSGDVTTTATAATVALATSAVPAHVVSTNTDALPSSTSSSSLTTSTTLPNPNYNSASLTSPPSTDGPSSELTMPITIPSGVVGTVIGRGGETLRRIQQATGARISITPGQPGEATRTVTIKGTMEQLQNARREIEAVVNGTQSASSAVPGATEL